MLANERSKYLHRAVAALKTAGISGEERHEQQMCSIRTQKKHAY